MESSGRAGRAGGSGRGGYSAAPAAARASRIRFAGAVLLIAHLLLVAWLSLRPLSVPWVAPANLHPFATIRADLGDGPRSALAGLGGQLLLLAPLGVLLPLAAGRVNRALPSTWTRTVLDGALVSSTIVLLQSGVPGHVVNVDSVLLNTAGVALACLLVFPPVRTWLRRKAAPSAGHGHRHGHGRGRGGVAGERSGGPDALHRREEAGKGSTPRAARVGIAP